MSRPVADGGLELRLLPGLYRVARLEADAPLPAGLIEGPSRLTSINRTSDELSILAEADLLPAEAPKGPLQRALVVRGPLDFELTGILAGLAGALADAGIPLFAISTFDTDYLLVPADLVDDAVEALRAAGNEVGGRTGEKTGPQ